MTSRTFVIGGSWYHGKPAYDLWEIVPKPRYPIPEYSEDDRWRDRMLPREHMKRKEIIEYLRETYGKGCDMKVMEFRTDGQQVFVMFTPMIVVSKEKREDG